MKDIDMAKLERLKRVAKGARDLNGFSKAALLYFYNSSGVTEAMQQFMDDTLDELARESGLFKDVLKQQERVITAQLEQRQRDYPLIRVGRAYAYYRECQEATKLAWDEAGRRAFEYREAYTLCLPTNIKQVNDAEAAYREAKAKEEAALEALRKAEQQLTESEENDHAQED